MQRELIVSALTGFKRAFVNQIAVFYESIFYFDKVVGFWHESGLTVHERYLEAASVSLADHYFGDFFDLYHPKARALLGVDSIEGMDPGSELNIDLLASLVYMLLLLLGKAESPIPLLNKPVLDIILEEIKLSADCSWLATSLKTTHLLAYLNFFLTGSILANDGEILATPAHKVSALQHAGLSSSEITVLDTLLNSLYLRFTMF
jgi:hypothetical protein